MRVVLIGKTGTGKSSVGNSLLKKKVFKSSAFGAADSTCEAGNRTLTNGTKLTVIDTPGLLATESSAEIAHCFDLCLQGPHMFLLVLKIGRFTPEDQTMVRHLVELFGDDVVKYVTIVFTGKDSLESDEIQLDEYLQDLPEGLSDLVSKCGRRAVAINNRAAESDREADVSAILHLVANEIKKNGHDYCYSKEMFTKIQQDVDRQQRFEEKQKFEEKQRFEENRRLEVERRQLEEIQRLEADGTRAADGEGDKITRQTQYARQDEEEVSGDMRVVLIGKTGTGKSSVGNSLLKKKVFKSSAFGAADSTCEAGNRTLTNGTKLTVIDTPGLLATESSTEIAYCFDLCPPGPHMFLLVLKIGRFTQEDQTMVRHLVELFGDDVVKYVTIVFTGKDSLESDGIQLDEYLQDVPKEFLDLISKSGRRVAAINNRAVESHKETDVNAILALVANEIKKIGHDYCYSKKMFYKIRQDADRQQRLKEEQQRLEEKQQRLEEKQRLQRLQEIQKMEAETSQLEERQRRGERERLVYQQQDDDDETPCCTLF